jgi:hypothetical protein
MFAIKFFPGTDQKCSKSAELKNVLITLDDKERERERGRERETSMNVNVIFKNAIRQNSVV